MGKSKGIYIELSEERNFVESWEEHSRQFKAEDNVI